MYSPAKPRNKVPIFHREGFGYLYSTMSRAKYYLVNAITIYRIVAAGGLVYLIFIGREDIFKWLLAVSFFTDMIDGFLARRYRAVSVLGSKIDSIGDDLTILAAIIGVVVLKPGFIIGQLPVVIALLVLYASQTIMALIRYGKLSSFHTYLAKGAALLQGVFLILFFFLPRYPLTLFYIAAAVTMLDLVEEIILVILLPKWETDVKGLYWINKRRGRE